MSPEPTVKMLPTGRRMGFRCAICGQFTHFNKLTVERHEDACARRPEMRGCPSCGRQAECGEQDIVAHCDRWTPETA
jgi:hypothetical protein